MEEESNNVGDGSDSFIIDRIAEIMEELPEVEQIIPKPSAPKDEDAVIELFPKTSELTRLKRKAANDGDPDDDEDHEEDQDSEEKMKQILLKEKTSELRRLRDEGLLPKLQPKIEALLNKYIDMGDSDSSETDSSDSKSVEILDPNVYIPEELLVYGFKDDCFKLLSKFRASKNRSFKDFTKVWQEMKLYGVFRQHELLDLEDLKLIFGFDDDNDDDDDYYVEEEEDDDDDDEKEEEEDDEEKEVDEDDHKVDDEYRPSPLTKLMLDKQDEEELRTKYIMSAVPEIFLIPKLFMLPEYPKSFRKGAFFLLYALYYRQPFKKDETLKIGEFPIIFDLAELCLLKQMYERETVKGKYELRQLYDRLTEDGGIEIKTTFHDPAPHVEDNELKSWYYITLMQERGAVEIVDKEWKKTFTAYSDLFASGSDYMFHETLWSYMEANKKNDLSLFKVSHSPIPQFLGEDEGPGFSVIQSDTKSVTDYLDEIPDIFPDPEPEIICLDDSPPSTPATTTITSSSEASTSEQGAKTDITPDPEPDIVCLDDSLPSTPATTTITSSAEASTSEQGAKTDITPDPEPDIVCMDDSLPPTPSTSIITSATSEQGANTEAESPSDTVQPPLVMD